jgi:protein O-GlcNAc transferase
MHADALLSKALSSLQQGKHREAEASYRAVLKKQPKNFTAVHHLGVLAYGQSRLREAHDLIVQAIALDGESPEAHNNLGNVLRAQGRLEEAAQSYRRALSLNPRNAGTHSNLAATLMDQKKIAESVGVLQDALSIDPRCLEAQINLGNAYRAMGQADNAIAAYRAAVEIDPSSYLSYVYLGDLLSHLGQLTEAINVLKKATELQAEPVGLNSLGICYYNAGRSAEAEGCFRHALKLKPDFLEAMANLANILPNLGRREEAVALNRAALKIKPDYAQAVSNLFFEQRHLCDWQDFEATEAKLRELVRRGACVTPFSFLTANTPPDEQLICARSFSASRLSTSQPALPSGPRQPGRIRIGYLSCDYKEHATAYLMAEMLERHDRERFEIFAYSYSDDDGSDIRRRLVAAFDHFVDIRELAHDAAVRKIREDGIDILVDLKGYTHYARPEIVAGRPARIQVSYLGYPGTMGTDCIDYLIADRFVAPEDQQQSFSEKLVYLPHCYQPNDTKRTISTLGLTRRHFGLPDNGIVFCSFNGNYKITPAMFDVWMRLLKATPGSVLWLLDTGTRVNLQREAEARGVVAERLVFAQGLINPQHLERMTLADLFLDSLPVNAHTTASDALWAGVPLLTCVGKAFVGRVAGSILTSIGLPDLITYSLEEYEAKALQLARNPAELKALRERLVQARQSAPLFDISRYTRDMESAYQAMFDRLQAGLPPETISVRDDSTPRPVPAMSWAKAEAGRMKIAPMIERVSAFAQEGSWLDVENGDPALILGAAEWGFAPVCLNTRAENVSLFQKLGFETHEQDVCALEAPGRFRVVSLTDLARFQSPPDALRAARNLLAENGVLLVVAANAESPLWGAISEAPPVTGGHSFSKASLYALLEECGFAPARFALSPLCSAGIEVVARKKAA